MIFETMREWAKSALSFVRRDDETAELCLNGDEWTIETDIGPERTFLNFRIVEWKRIASTKEAA